MLPQSLKKIATIKSFTCVLLLCASLSPVTVLSDDTVIRVTGIPDENPTKLARKFQAMVDYLEQEMDVKVSYVPVTDYGAAVSALAAGKIDFAWLGGFTHVQARVLADAKPVVMRGIDRKFKSVFIAHADSGIESEKDFKGKTFAFGSKSSTSGHLMPRHFLTTQLKINPETGFDGKPVYSGAHDATVKMVESGRVQGGAVNAEVWQRMVDNGSVDTSKVKLVWTTPDYVDYVWTAGRDVKPELVEKFRQAFLKLKADNAQHKTVLELQGAEKFVIASVTDFDAIEKVARDSGLLK